MTRLWQLSINANADEAFDLSERLGFLDGGDALSVSVSESQDGMRVDAIYDTVTSAEHARQTIGRGKIEELPDQDWVALTQEGLPPIEAGRFLVHGSHDEPDTRGRIPIIVDAGAAFGTGHHGTTKGCLLMLSDLADDGFEPDAILDLGTGAGLLAIAAAKLFPKGDMLATDIDADAVAVTQANALLNDVTVPCIQADGFDTPDLKSRTFDLILANILAGPLRGLAPDIAKTMRPGGMAVLSGILDEQADWVAGSFTAQGLQVQKKPSLDGWTSLLASKPEA